MPLKYFSIGLLIWNLSLGVIPYHFLELNADKKLAEYVRDHEPNLYILNEKIKIQRILEYYYPNEKFNVESYSDESDPIISQSKLPVLTDIINNKTSISRSTMLNDNIQSAFDKYTLTNVDSIKYDLGVLKLTRIDKK